MTPDPDGRKMMGSPRHPSLPGAGGGARRKQVGGGVTAEQGWSHLSWLPGPVAYL